MTITEAKLGSQRLRELEEKKILREESMRMLKEWWHEVLRAGEHGKIIPFPMR